MDKERKFLISKVGKFWVDCVSDKELEYFIVWAKLTRVYQFDEPIHIIKHDTADAFRGFVMGLKYVKN